MQVFQIVSQAIVQNFFPRFHIYHTSRKHKGQVQRQASCMLTPTILVVQHVSVQIDTRVAHIVPNDARLDRAGVHSVRQLPADVPVHHHHRRLPDV